MGSQAGYSNRDAGICSWVASLASPGHSAETQEAFNLKRDQGSKSYDEPRQRWIIEKAEEPEIKLPICAVSSKKQESSRKTSTSASLTTPKPLCGSQQTGKFFKRWGYLTCLLINLYAGHEAPVKTRHRTMDWFQIVKGIPQGCIVTLLI